MAEPSIQDVLTAVAAVAGEVGKLRADVTQMQGDMKQMQGDMKQMQSDIKQLQGDMKQMQGEMKQFRGELTQLRVDVMDRIDRLQDALTLQKDDLVVNYSAADRAEKIARAAQEETRALGDIVTPMIRQIRRLQEDVRHLRGEP